MELAENTISVTLPAGADAPLFKRAAELVGIRAINRGDRWLLVKRENG
jgi:hypothetical protein